MNMILPTDSLADIVARANDRLTPSEQVLARVMLEDPTAIAFGTVADLARMVDVSPPTITRFARTIGFGGYGELQHHVQTLVTRRITRPSDRIRSAEKDSSTLRRTELLTALDHLFDQLTDERVAALSLPITKADTVYIVSGETSLAGARILESGLVILGKNTVFVDEHTGGGRLGSVDEGDVVVAFDFHRYRRWTYGAVVHLKSSGATIVAITDGALSPYAAIADEWCDVVIPGFGPFDSSVPAAVVAESIVGGVATALGDDAVSSIDRTEAAWGATSTFLD